MEKHKTKMSIWEPEGLQSHQSPADSELRRKLRDQFVTDAAFGRFMRTTDPFLDPPPLIFPHNLTRSLPEGITRKELGIINLTAQFMAVYGIFFQRSLIKTVSMDPRFGFMTKPDDDSSFAFYCKLFILYMAVSKPCQVLTENAGASPETVLEGFFDLLTQLEKQEDERVVGKVGMFDLNVVEYLGKSIPQITTLPSGHLSNVLQPWRHRLIELLKPDRPDGSGDKIRELELEMLRVTSCRYWRSLVSYQACYQQMQVLSQDHAFCEHPPPTPQPKDLKNNSDQGPVGRLPSFLIDPPPKFTCLIPKGITPKELGIIKLTAQFGAVYGLYFLDDIEKRVIVDPLVDPRFEFLKPTDGRYFFFSQLTLGYERVLIPSRKNGEASSGPPSLETIHEGFWTLVEMVEKGVDMDMGDLYAFEYFANTEDQELNLPPHYLSMMMHPLVPPITHLQGAPRREHPNPKRLKVVKY